MSDAPQIQRTKDYSIFKMVRFNREKNKRHIESVKKIIAKENLLHLHPILVNEYMEVIDGQHRLEAAKELGVEVFYIKDKISYDHILHSNLFQKKMSLEDVIKFYSLKDKLPDYVQFNDYLHLLKISPKAFIGLLFGVISPALLEFIKTGNFKMPSSLHTVEKLVSSLSRFMHFVNEKRITPKSMFSSSSFTIAFRNLVLLNAFSEDIFMNKLELRWFELNPQLNTKEWTKQLIAIYNWKNHNPITESVS